MPDIFPQMIACVLLLIIGFLYPNVRVSSEAVGAKRLVSRLLAPDYSEEIVSPNYINDLVLRFDGEELDSVSSSLPHSQERIPEHISLDIFSRFQPTCVSNGKHELDKAICAVL